MAYVCWSIYTKSSIKLVFQLTPHKWFQHIRKFWIVHLITKRYYKMLSVCGCSDQKTVCRWYNNNILLTYLQLVIANVTYLLNFYVTKLSLSAKVINSYHWIELQLYIVAVIQLCTERLRGDSFKTKMLVELSNLWF